MRRSIILSYDYELFFGDESGTIEKSLIHPTNSILDTMDKYNLKGNFFIDYLMFKYLEQNTDERSKSDLALLKHQIQDIVRRGHRIELHLHPHWVDATYNGDGTWDFSNYTHYMLSTFTEEEIQQFFIEGVNYLHRLVHTVDPNYTICAFRAGGWAIQPFSKLKSAFQAAHIKIDSSSAFGVYNLKSDQCYDFRIMPQKAMYFFEDDVCQENETGSFLEVPITSFHRNLLYIGIDKVFRKFHFIEKLTDGTHVRKNDPLNISNNKKIRRLDASFKSMFTMSGYSCISVLLSLLFYKKQDLYCYIDHPKDFTESTLQGLTILGKIAKTITYKDLLKSQN